MYGSNGAGGATMGGGTGGSVGMAESPTIGESAGRLVNELQLGLETLFGLREERYHRNTKEQN